MHKNGYVAVGDTNMYYAAFGSGSKNLVVLPGLSDGLTTVKGKAWLLAPSYKRFFHEFTVYMFSRMNDMPEGYSIEDMADDQVTVMKNFGIDRACVLGVSQGGMIAQSIAIRHLEVVERPTLILSGSDDKTVGNDAPHELKEGIADSELFVYEGLGHGAFEEAKDFYDRVLAFCRG